MMNERISKFEISDLRLRLSSFKIQITFILHPSAFILAFAPGLFILPSARAMKE
jgi:hypothetical protein